MMRGQGRYYLMAGWLMLVALTSASVLTIGLSPLIYAGYSGLIPFYRTFSLDYSTVLRNYWVLYRYLIAPWQPVLEFPDFISSAHGLQHFSEVRQLMWFLVLICFIAWLGLIKAYRIRKNFAQLYIKAALRQLQYSLMVILGVAALFFDQAFILFHRVVFRNDFWLFDPMRDPIILILPQTLFLVFFLSILISYLAISRGLYRWLWR